MMACLLLLLLVVVVLLHEGFPVRVFAIAPAMCCDRQPGINYCCKPKPPAGGGPGPHQGEAAGNDGHQVLAVPGHRGVLALDDFHH
jgi:hypothetical protein